jgi:hypothetical protein
MGCGLPVCQNQSEFASRHIEVTDADTESVLAYIWQRKAPDGNFVRASLIDFEDPGSLTARQPQAGRHPRNLWVDAQGGV